MNILALTWMKRNGWDNENGLYTNYEMDNGDDMYVQRWMVNVTMSGWNELVPWSTHGTWSEKQS